MNIKVVSTEFKEMIKSQISFLIVTATDIETREVLNNFSELPSEQGIIEVAIANQTYYVGILGVYKVVLVQSKMGSTAPNSSLLTTLRAIEVWNPKAILMVGIAFGIDPKKQRIGDVLISSHIIPYENTRINKDDSRIYRSELPPASTLLINRIKNVRDWDFKITKSRSSKVYLGPLLTGEKLIDNNDFKRTLVKNFPNTIGGEMESAGVYSAATEKNLDWLIIKGICDFADGEKKVSKKRKQEIAISASVNFLKHFLSKRFIFKDLEIKSYDEDQYSRPIISRGTDFDILLGLLDSILDKAEDQSNVEIIRLAARELVQSRVDDKLEREAVEINTLVPHNILSRFEKRVQNCWDSYNEVLAEEGGYLPGEIDEASISLIACICRELRRLNTVNGGIPNGKLLEYWDKYKC